MVAGPTSIASCSPSKATSCRCFTFAMAVAGQPVACEQSVHNFFPNTTDESVNNLRPGEPSRPAGRCALASGLRSRETPGPYPQWRRFT
jgi:hypothetical protein